MRAGGRAPVADGCSRGCVGPLSVSRAALEGVQPYLSYITRAAWSAFSRYTGLPARRGGAHVHASRGVGTLRRPASAALRSPALPHSWPHSRAPSILRIASCVHARRVRWPPWVTREGTHIRAPAKPTGQRGQQPELQQQRARTRRAGGVVGVAHGTLRAAATRAIRQAPLRASRCHAVPGRRPRRHQSPFYQKHFPFPCPAEAAQAAPTAG